MIKHIVMWDFSDGLSCEEKTKSVNAMKKELEGLLGVIPGLVEMILYTNMMKSSNADILLYSVLSSPAILSANML